MIVNDIMVYGNAQWFRRSHQTPVITAGVQGSDRTTYNMQWLQAVDLPFDLTGAVISGTITDESTGSVYSITGGLVIVHGVKGEFTWRPSEMDTAIAGVMSVQFRATFGGGLMKEFSYPSQWRILEMAEASAVGGPPLVGVPEGDADVLADFSAGLAVAGGGDVYVADGAGGGAWASALVGSVTVYTGAAEVLAVTASGTGPFEQSLLWDLSAILGSGFKGLAWCYGALLDVGGVSVTTVRALVTDVTPVPAGTGFLAQFNTTAGELVRSEQVRLPIVNGKVHIHITNADAVNITGSLTLMGYQAYTF